VGEYGLSRFVPAKCLGNFEQVIQLKKQPKTNQLKPKPTGKQQPISLKKLAEHLGLNAGTISVVLN